MAKNTIKQIHVLATVTLLAVALAACSNPITSIGKVANEQAIGQGSGSGKLVSKGARSFAKDQFDQIELNTSVALVHITRTEKDEATVEFLADDSINNTFEFDAAVEAGKLVVNVVEKSEKGLVKLKEQRGERKLLVALPEKAYQALSLQTEVGEVKLDQIEASNVKVKVDVGNIAANEVSGALDFRVNVGDIKVTNASNNQPILVKADVGSINVALKEQPVSGEYDLSSDVGEVKLSLPNVEYQKQTSSKIKGSIGSGGPSVELQANIGEINLHVK